MAYKKPKQEQKLEQAQESENPEKAPAAEHKAKPAPPVCEGCWRWSVFEEKCWYYWDGKKYCTMWSSDPNELPPM